MELGRMMDIIGVGVSWRKFPLFNPLRKIGKAIGGNHKFN
jgi:hypothetical protein